MARSAPSLMKGANRMPQGNRLGPYFLLVFVFSVPYWLFGRGKLPLPVNLPVSALMGFVPWMAASILSLRASGSHGLKQFLARAFDYREIKNRVWYLPILLLMPLIYVLSYAVMRWMDMPLPDPKIRLLDLPVFFLMYFVEAVGEELGWMGYAVDSMQDRWGALKAGLILGIIDAIWHIIGFIQTGNSAGWIAGQWAYSVALRILILWIYNNAGRSVFAAILVHAMSNLSWSFFPNFGSHYDPIVTGLISWLVVGLLVCAWGAKTLARFRFGARP